MEEVGVGGLELALLEVVGVALWVVEEVVLMVQS